MNLSSNPFNPPSTPSPELDAVAARIAGAWRARDSLRDEHETRQVEHDRVEYEEVAELVIGYFDGSIPDFQSKNPFKEKSLQRLLAHREFAAFGGQRARKRVQNCVWARIVARELRAETTCDVARKWPMTKLAALYKVREISALREIAEQAENEGWSLAKIRKKVATPKEAKVPIKGRGTLGQWAAWIGKTGAVAETILAGEAWEPARYACFKEGELEELRKHVQAALEVFRRFGAEETFGRLLPAEASKEGV